MLRLFIMEQIQHREDVSIEGLAILRSNKATEISIRWQGHGVSFLKIIFKKVKQLTAYSVWTYSYWNV